MDRNTIDNVITRINECTGGRFKYVSGYQNKDSKVKIKCKECNAIIERTYHHITTAGMRQCPECHRREKESAEREKAKARIERKERAAKRKDEKERRKAERMKPKPCKVCGRMTTQPKYCSKECRDKANNKRKDVRRQKKINKAMVDRDITVAGLYKRDRGICYLCGEACSLEDYTIRDNIFIAGDWYPSIDHVMPLTKGGMHSWKNVKLAHRICNSKKSSKIF